MLLTSICFSFSYIIIGEILHKFTHKEWKNVGKIYTYIRT